MTLYRKGDTHHRTKANKSRTLAILYTLLALALVGAGFVISTSFQLSAESTTAKDDINRGLTTKGITIESDHDVAVREVALVGRPGDQDKPAGLLCEFFNDRRQVAKSFSHPSLPMGRRLRTSW